MAADQKIELELALRDSVSLALKTIATNLETVNAKLTRGGEEIRVGTDTLSKVAKNTKDIGESAKTASRYLVGLGDTMIKMSSMMLTGPVAIGAGMVAATAAIGRQLKGVADERLRLKALSEDSGLSENQISIMMRTQARQGINPEQATKNIEMLTGKLKAMSTDKTGSELFRGLADIGMARFGKQLLDSVTSGDYAKAVRLIFDQYEEIRRTHGAEAAAAYAEVVGVNESFLQTYKARSEGVKPAFQMSLESAKSWADRWAIVHENLAMMWDVTVGNLIWSLVRGEEIVNKIGKAIPKEPRVGPDYVAPGVGGPLTPGNPPSSQDTEDFKDSKKESSKYLNDISGILERMWEKTKGLVGRQEGGPVQSWRDYLVGEQGPELFSGGGRYQLVGEGGREIFRPGTSGNITKADLTRVAEVGEEYARQYQPGGPDFAAKILDVRRIPGAMKVDAASGYHVRNLLRRFMGMEPTNMPASWAEGGSWDQAQRFGDEEEEHQKYMESMAAMSAQIAPGGLGWEKWRRSGNVEGVESSEAEMESWEETMRARGETYEQTATRLKAGRADFGGVGPMSYEAGWGDLDRMAIDRSAETTNTSSVAGEMNFRNIPPGVKVETDSEGLDDFRVNKTKQLESAF